MICPWPLAVCVRAKIKLTESTVSAMSKSRRDAGVKALGSWGRLFKSRAGREGKPCKKHLIISDTLRDLGFQR